jgi:hypothetical protein
VVELRFPNRRSGELARELLNGNGASDTASRRRRLRLDGRSAPAVAIRKRLSGYRSVLKGVKITPVLSQKLQDLAKMEVIHSALTEAALLGLPTDLLAVSRFANTIARLRSACGLDNVPAARPPAPRSLRDIVRGRR